MELTTFVFVLLAINGVCIFLDSWLLKKEKKKLHHFLVKMFMKIDDLKVPRIHRQLALKISEFLKNLKIFGSQKYGFWFYAIVTSVILTLFSYMVGSSLDREINQQFLKNEQYMINNGVFVIYFIVAITANAIFDLTSLSISRYHIRILSHSGYVKFVFIILRDFTCAFVLSILLLNLVFYFSLYFDGLRLGLETAYPSIIELTIFHSESMFKVLFEFQVSEVLSLERTWIPFSYVVYSATTFIPTFIFLTFLLLIYIVKIMISIVRSIVLRYIDKVTEENEENVKPFTLIGITLSLMAAILRVVIEYSKT